MPRKHNYFYPEHSTADGFGGGPVAKRTAGRRNLPRRIQQGVLAAVETMVPSGERASPESVLHFSETLMDRAGWFFRLLFVAFQHN